MTLDALIMLAGALVAIVPLMEGLPDAWQRIILVLLGILVIALGIAVRRRSSRHSISSPEWYEPAAPAPRPTPEEETAAFEWREPIAVLESFETVEATVPTEEAVMVEEVQPEMPVITPAKKTRAKRASTTHTRRTSHKKRSAADESSAPSMAEHAFHHAVSHEEEQLS